MRVAGQRPARLGEPLQERIGLELRFLLRRRVGEREARDGRRVVGLLCHGLVYLLVSVDCAKRYFSTGTTIPRMMTFWQKAKTTNVGTAATSRDAKTTP